ncbi:MAG: uncharacterized protein JWQ07_1638 [Ramlibacter sp.]|nr:uncharacterized protein [Ramlibacter sp.]
MSFFRLLAGLCAALCGPVGAADAYDAGANQLSIPKVQVGNILYNDVVVQLGAFQVASVGSHALLPGIDTYDPSNRRLTLPGVRVGTTVYGNVVLQLGGDFAVLAVGGSRTSAPPTPATPHIARISVTGQPVLVFDHLTDKREPFHLPDLPATAWKDADGMVNLPVIGSENYRMRGPDLEHLTSDPTPTFSSSTMASQIVEANYNYHHWIGSPYTFDGRIVHALVHSEWYACLLNNDCNVTVPATALSTGSYQLNSWANTITSFKSLDGGASWSANGVDNAHVVANESWTWTGSAALADAVYRRALNHTGLMSPTRIVKEGDWYYSIGFLVHRNPATLEAGTGQAPIDKNGWVLMRTTDVSVPSSWQAWGQAGYAPMSSHALINFIPKLNGADLNSGHPQLIYDTNAKVYVVMFAVFGGTQLHYVTTPSLTNPVWSNAAVVAGSGTLATDPRSASATCPTGFVPVNYPSAIDSHSNGLNFEFTDGDPWLFYVVNPALCGGDNLARDLYRLQLAIEYE